MNNSYILTDPLNKVREKFKNAIKSNIIIVCIGVSTTPFKITTTLFLANSLLKLANCLTPLFCQSPPSIVVFRETFKSWIFHWTHKISKFFTLTPSYLLKVTKFLVKTSQFEFLVMIEKNIFAYKLFLSLNI